MITSILNPFSAKVAYAATCAADAICPVGNAPSTNANTTNFATIIRTVGGTVLTLLTLIAGILAVIYLIWSGIQYITASGSADKAKAARAGIINASIGIVIIVAAYFIVRVSIGVGRTVSCSDQTNGAANATCN